MVSLLHGRRPNASAYPARTPHPRVCAQKRPRLWHASPRRGDTDSSHHVAMRLAMVRIATMVEAHCRRHHDGTGCTECARPVADPAAAPVSRRTGSIVTDCPHPPMATAHGPTRRPTVFAARRLSTDYHHRFLPQWSCGTILGQEMPIPRGPLWFAQRSGKPIVPLFIAPEHNGWRLTIGEPIEQRHDALCAAIDAAIREAPACWERHAAMKWFHTRPPRAADAPPGC